MLSGFVRRMPVLCLCGAWCGDCINQCPAFDHFARASTAIDLRFLDRDADPAVADALSINGGHRVPVLVFLSEDFQEVFRYGERTLSIYRKLAADQLGPSCPTGLVPPSPDAIALSVSEWLNEFELRPARPPPVAPPAAAAWGLRTFPPGFPTRRPRRL